MVYNHNDTNSGGMYMYTITNFKNNENIKTLDRKGMFEVIEHQLDLSVTRESAQEEYFASKMNVKRKQLLCTLNSSEIVMQTGSMQWMVGDVEMETGVKSAGDLFGKMFRGSVTNESSIKPHYSGSGLVALEPTNKHIVLLDVSEWGEGIVLEDGLFLASESGLKHSLQSRANLSSAVLGNEGFFNLAIEGDGIVALESISPLEELIEIDLHDDVLKVDGSMAIAWSKSLNFSVQRSSKSLLGSAASGEGLVNVYSGTGKVLMAPVSKESYMQIPVPTT